MSPLTKQDVQNVMDNYRNQLLQRAATKQDIQNMNDTLKSLLNINQQNQQTLRQAEYQRSQLTRRVIALETRIVQLEQEIRSYRDAANRAAAQSQPQIVVAQPAAEQQRMDGGQYVYRPA